MPNLIWVDQAMIEAIAEVEGFIDNKNIGSARKRVTPSSSNGRDGDVGDWFKLVVEAIDFTLLTREMDRSAINASARSVRATVQLAFGLDAKIGGRADVLDLGAFYRPSKYSRSTLDRVDIHMERKLSDRL